MSGPAGSTPAWDDARLAAVLFAIDPHGLGGVVLRAGPGPVRDRWLALLKAALPAGAPIRRIPLNIEDDRLLGGLDLPATLAAGRPVGQRGVLAECDGGVAVLSMAERLTEAVGARLTAALDRGELAIERDGLALRLPARLGVVALDEGLDPDERPPDALVERLAFLLDFNGQSAMDRLDCELDFAAIARARAALSEQAAPPAAVVEAICEAALALGLDSLRAPLLTLAAARAHAAWRGAGRVDAEDAAAAVRLVLVPRARTAPAADAAEPAEPPAQPESPPADSAAPPPDTAEAPQPPPEAEIETEPPTEPSPPSDAELMIAAIRASLPEDLLSRLDRPKVGRARPARSSGAGARIASSRRGRPVGSRQGALRPGDRLNLVETLRAAAPWRKLRGAAPEGRLPVRPQDFRVRRFIQSRESTTIFVVDASGSTAFQRLAEAKGAVELLLAKAYVTRARVALIAFRHTGAELLLPPTKSLTRARRRLAELPGGGGTPLACGLEAGLDLALAETGRDRTPLLVVLTDGRANIDRDGAPGRAAAEAHALAAATRIGEARVGAVYLDTSPRAQPGGDRFARAMGAVYAPLPYVDARAVSGLVEDLRAR